MRQDAHTNRLGNGFDRVDCAFEPLLSHTVKTEGAGFNFREVHDQGISSSVGFVFVLFTSSSLLLVSLAFSGIPKSSLTSFPRLFSSSLSISLAANLNSPCSLILPSASSSYGTVCESGGIDRSFLWSMPFGSIRRRWASQIGFANWTKEIMLK